MVTIRQAVRASLGLLNRRDRRLLGAAILVQMATALLDLLGVTLIGLVGAMSIATVQGQQPPKSVGAVIVALGLGELPQPQLLGLIAGAAAVVLLSKSVLSPLLMRRVFEFLAGRQAIVSGRLAKALLGRPLTFVQQRSSQETAAALLQGVGAATVVTLGQTVVAASEIALLSVLAVALLLVDPGVALGALVFFTFFGAGLQRALGHRMSQVSAQWLTADIASLSAVQEVVGSYREITVADRRSLYVDRIQRLRSDAARAAASFQVFSILPKYMSEAAVVIGAFSLAAVLFATRPVPEAAGTFALFLATATRIMPSLLRLQGAALAIRGAAGAAALTYQLADELGHPLDGPPGREQFRATVRRITQLGHRGFVPRIELHNVSFTYPVSTDPAIREVSMVVEPGQSVALVGRSGAGKSTLADVILGVLEPDAGELTVSGLDPAEAVCRWPGAIAYVPQDVLLSNDSVRGNVAVGIPGEDVDDDLVWDALRRAHLEDHFRGLPDGLETQIGERGLRLSGGQRQRLGLARALFTRPRLLVLDEATSALDAETELAVTEMLGELETDVTTVIVAHRLSTIRNADLVLYIENGLVQSQGTFEEVCLRVPALRRQASIVGLEPSQPGRSPHLG